MIDRFEQFTSTISVIYRDIQKLERDEMEKYGLKGAYAQYLIVMRRCRNGVTAAQLCELCDKDKAAVSRVVAEMEAKGLVERKGGSNYYRALLRLTEEGTAAADYVCRRATVAVELAGTGLNEPERKALYAALELIASNLQDICRAGIPRGESRQQ